MPRWNGTPNGFSPNGNPVASSVLSTLSGRNFPSKHCKRDNAYHDHHTTQPLCFFAWLQPRLDIEPAHPQSHLS